MDAAENRKAPTRGERTRSALVEAGRTRFAAVGFEAALGADIAADAGVSEPSIGFHFGSKRGLFIAVMEWYFDRTLEELEAVVDLSVPPIPRLASFTQWWIEHLTAHRDLIVEFEHQARPGRLGDDVTDAYRRLNGRFGRVWLTMIDQLKAIGFLRSDIDSAVIMQMFIGATRQVVGDDVADQSSRNDDRVRQLLDLVLSGAAAAERTAADAPATTDEKLDLILRRLDALDNERSSAT